MEPRFGHEFSQVRVHTDRKASESANAVAALAYTVGKNIVFRTGHYTPRTPQGTRLLAHELTHVVQQADVPASGSLSIGGPDTNAEREADEVAARFAFESRTVPPIGRNSFAVSKFSQPLLRRWKISGNTATSNEESDTLGGLAQKAGARFNDWKCIQPVSMRTSTLGKPPSNFDDRYELYVQSGDTFDVSNLTATAGTSVSIYLFDDAAQNLDANLARLFYAGSTSSSDADTDFDRASSSGSAPIGEMVIFGHAGGSSMWGGASTFTPSDFPSEEPRQSFALAHAALFPRRCWFTRNATARSVGCDSENWGEDFAAHYLRLGASVTTTTKSVRPKCTAPLVVGGVCTSYDGVDFASGPSPSATSLDGPFWTSADFHAGKYWKTIKGKL